MLHLFSGFVGDVMKNRFERRSNDCWIDDLSGKRQPYKLTYFTTKMSTLLKLFSLDQKSKSYLFFLSPKQPSFLYRWKNYWTDFLVLLKLAGGEKDNIKRKVNAHLLIFILPYVTNIKRFCKKRFFFNPRMPKIWKLLYPQTDLIFWDLPSFWNYLRCWKMLVKHLACK